VHFQEALFARQIIFVAGVAEAKSKGRGEECISQNLRILRSRNGTQTIMFFANSQRKERKGYISIPGKERA
jgi:aspartate carbamoyltransferase regulatory subunit